MDFYSAYAQGFARVAACTVPVAIADPATNAARTLEQVRALHEQGVAVAVFPELGLTGYAVDDLFLQDTLLASVRTAIAELVEASTDLLPVIVVGAPLEHGNRIYNCAVVIHRGRILGAAPKSYLPNYREFYERRWFAPGDDLASQTIELAGQEVPLGPDLIFNATDVPGLHLHVEICEDMWVPVPPSAQASLAGATVLANLSASPVTVGRSEGRRQLVQSASNRCNAAYLYTAAGSGRVDHRPVLGRPDHGLRVRRPARRERAVPRRPAGDRRRRRPRPAAPGADPAGEPRRQPARGLGGVPASTSPTSGFVEFELAPPTGDIGLLRKVDRYPFVPDDPARLALDCYEAYNIQVSGLEQRLAAIGQPKVVIGVSGGLDSTHALIVAAKAMDRLGRPRSDIHAFTMPGFATGETTKSYATRLATALGCTFAELDIKPAAEQMLEDLDHPFSEGQPTYDVTFENVQAGLRTDYLFRLANHRGGIVLGTGDLSELALGWCTYGVGDQMSHYNVNAGVPEDADPAPDPVGDRQQAAARGFAVRRRRGLCVLREILEQEITPELIPTTEGVKPQATEDSVGPLRPAGLHALPRHPPRLPPEQDRLPRVARVEGPGRRGVAAGIPGGARTSYDLATVRRWLEVFVQRFFASQFKRSALPNGPKVSNGGTMSPRGDWRMPSDASAAAWLAELEANVPR